METLTLCRAIGYANAAYRADQFSSGYSLDRQTL